MGDTAERVRKLLAKAERAATEAEAVAYTAKAAELAARHGLDAALRSGAGDPDPVGVARIALAGPHRAGKARLLGWTAAALHCRWALHPAGRGDVEAVSVVGLATDRDRVRLLYSSLLVQADRELARCRPAEPGTSVAAYRRSWWYGFAARVHERLTAAEAAALATATDGGPATGGGGVALVLADRAARVERRFTVEFPHLAPRRAARASGAGFAAGGRAGATADLGGPRLSTGAHAVR